MVQVLNLRIFNLSVFQSSGKYYRSRRLTCVLSSTFKTVAHGSPQMLVPTTRRHAFSCNGCLKSQLIKHSRILYIYDRTPWTGDRPATRPASKQDLNKTKGMQCTLT